MLSGLLAWYPEAGIGHMPITDTRTKRDYFAEYQVLAITDMGKAITDARVQLVRKWLIDQEAPVLDIGIGCGAFVAAYGFAGGYDVDPKGVAWLVNQGAYVDPYRENIARYHALTFWDSIEHIEDPGALLGKPDAPRFVFISTPIYPGAAETIASKHFKPFEHRWYFTFQGLVRVLAKYGYALKASNRMECDLGREDIETFVFQKEAKQ